LSVFSNRAPMHKSGIVSLVPKSGSPKDLMKKCRDAGVIVNVRADRVRVSPHAYNTESEIDRFLDVARSLTSSLPGGG